MTWCASGPLVISVKSTCTFARDAGPAIMTAPARGLRQALCDIGGSTGRPPAVGRPSAQGGRHAVRHPIEHYPGHAHEHHGRQEKQSREPWRGVNSLLYLADGRLGLPLLAEEDRRDQKVDSQQHAPALDGGIEQADREELSRHNDSCHCRQAHDGSHRTKLPHTLVPGEGPPTHDGDPVISGWPVSLAPDFSVRIMRK